MIPRDVILAYDPMQLGLVVAISLPVGGLGLPFLVDFLLHAWHYQRAARKDALYPNQAMSLGCPMGGAHTASPGFSHTFVTCDDEADNSALQWIAVDQCSLAVRTWH